MANSEGDSFRSIIQQDPGLPRDNPTTSFWQTPPHKLSSAQSAELPTVTDIAIIGSGITGASVVKTILENHDTAQVVVFEARTVCSGATGRNGGQLAINAAETYIKRREALGAKMAGKIVKFNLKTLEAMREIAAQFSEGLSQAQDPEVTEVTKVRAFNDEETFRSMREGIAALESDHPDMRGVYTVLDKEACEKDYGVHGSVGGVVHPAGSVWPYRMVTNLLDAFLRRYSSRLAIENNTPVTEVVYEPSTDAKYPYIVHTPRGCVRASQVAYCTNAYTGHLLPKIRGILFPLKETMTVQELSPPMIWPIPASWAIHYTPFVDGDTGHYADGLIYGMQSPNSGYYFFGGEKCPPENLISSDDTALAGTSVQFLQDQLLSLFGLDTGRSKVVSSWTGVMCFSSDLLPLVGRLPSDLTGRSGSGEWLCGAYNGYGMPCAWLAGESLGLMILGKTPRDYLPEAYLISERRLKETLSVERSMGFLNAP
ncbi:nucleotide-binding domain-containing protein [Aspergillus pseudoustus]|uniref:Nucleotide-binding domain-containing protein n=1 Tax=Aspergillus pseudoustus TaxID=1810923 RepID=A0ABR4JNF9_9EURO